MHPAEIELGNRAGQPSLLGETCEAGRQFFPACCLLPDGDSSLIQRQQAGRSRRRAATPATRDLRGTAVILTSLLPWSI